MQITEITSTLISVIELASIYSIVTLAIVFSFRMVGFADLTINSSFTTGAAIGAIVLTKTSLPPYTALFAATFVGIVAGFLTAMLHVKGRISRLLAGIIMMTVLYSINLQIMGKSNIQLVNKDTIFTNFGSSVNPFILFITAISIYGGSFLLLKTHLGYLLRTCGENPCVIEKLGYRPGAFIILALVISNALTSFSGAIASQYFGFADIGMGTGLIVTVLAALILGEAICPPKSIFRLLAAAFLGSILYRLAFEIGLRMNIHPWNLQIVVGLLLALALVIKQNLNKRRNRLFVGVEAL